MQELNINSKYDHPMEIVALTPARKKMIESKIQHALLRVLILNGGEIVRLKPQRKGKSGRKS